MTLTAQDYQAAAAAGLTADELRRLVFVRGIDPKRAVTAQFTGHEPKLSRNHASRRRKG